MVYTDLGGHMKNENECVADYCRGTVGDLKALCIRCEEINSLYREITILERQRDVEKKYLEALDQVNALKAEYDAQ